MRNVLAHVSIGLCRSPGGISAELTGASTARGNLLVAAPLEIGWKAIWPSMVAAAFRQASLQPDRTAAGQTWRQVAEQLRPRPRWPAGQCPFRNRMISLLADHGPSLPA